MGKLRLQLRNLFYNNFNIYYLYQNFHFDNKFYYLILNNSSVKMGIGDWGLGIGDWGVGIGRNPQSPIPNPQSPIPNPHISVIFIKKYIINYFEKIFKCSIT